MTKPKYQFDVPEKDTYIRITGDIAHQGCVAKVVFTEAEYVKGIGDCLTKNNVLLVKGSNTTTRNLAFVERAVEYITEEEYFKECLKGRKL